MQNRLEKLCHLMSAARLDGVALNPGPSLTYLTGLHFHLMERPTVVLIGQDGRGVIVLPELESAKLAGAALDLTAFTYGDDPGSWQAVFTQACQHLDLHTQRVGVEPARLRFLELQFLRQAAPAADFVDGSAALDQLRVQKDAGEINRMRQAAVIAQNALRQALQAVHAGITEKALANQLVMALLQAGSAPEMPFQPIVAFGENSANPHCIPSDRPLQAGDLVLIDWGAGFEGYFSDITRTFTFGHVPPALLSMGALVLAANRAGRAAGKPGLEIGAVDRAARAVIDAGGYGEAFIHRTGHGLGMDAHEPPYVFGENSGHLAPGMTFTVEPGIYLPGRGGVRIEDDVAVTDLGLESLTDFPRPLSPLEDFIG